MMGGKDGSPGGGVPAHELWWRIPAALMFAVLALALMFAPLLALTYFVNGRL
jgi:hypothetical protein